LILRLQNLRFNCLRY